MNDTITLLIVDDHAIVRHGLTSLFENETDIRVVGEASNGEQALREVARLRPSVVIMDLLMPKMDGVEATTAVKAQFPETKIVVLTTFGTANGIAQALDAGADGALTKSVEDERLIATIRQVAAGKRIISPEIRRMLAENPPIPALTPRQRDILASITRGLTNKDIATELGIRRDGVDRHVSDILEKIGAANRTEAAVLALRKHLLKI